jgi:hypothetical protein
MANPYDDASFIQKLRMNNIFPAQGNPSPLIGMPNFYSGRPYYQPRQTGLQTISNSVINRPAKPLNESDVLMGDVNTPKNVIYKPSPMDEAGDKILNEPLQQSQQKTGFVVAKGDNTPVTEIGEGAGEPSELDKLKYGSKIVANNINQQKIDLATYKAKNPNMKFIISKGGNVQAFNPITGSGFDTGIDSGTLSDSDKQALITDRGMSEITAKGDQNIKAIGAKGDQNLKAIGARVAGQQDINSSKASAATKDLLPTQQGAQQRNAALQLKNTRPDLAQYITIQPNGQFAVDPDTPLNELSMIQNAIYPTNNKDIQLTNKPDNSTPTSKTPTADMKLNDPLGIR